MTTQNRELASLIDNSGNVTATGNLTVSGTTTAVSSTNTTVTDPLIEINNGAGSNSNDLGFVMERGSTGDNACLIWDESNDAFAVGTTTATGTSTGNMSYTTGDFLAGKVTVDNVIINGTTIGHTDDTDLMTLADGALTVAGNVTASNFYVADDIIHSGDADTYMSWNADNLTIYNGGTNNLYMAAGEVIFNDGSGDVDFRVESNGNANMLKVDAGNDRVSIGGAGGTAEFNVAKSVSLEQVALSSSGNAITWDADAAGNAFHVTTENTTIGKASNGTEGQIIMIEIEQGGTARTVAWHGDYEFAASTAPTVTATANKTDIFTFRYNGTVWHEIGRVQNMSKT